MKFTFAQNIDTYSSTTDEEIDKSYLFLLIREISKQRLFQSNINRYSTYDKRISLNVLNLISHFLKRIIAEIVKIVYKSQSTLVTTEICPVETVRFGSI